MTPTRPSSHALRARLRSILLTASCALAVAACGGGSTDSANNAAVVTDPPNSESVDNASEDGDAAPTEGSEPDDATRITDASGDISIIVPAEWADVVDPGGDRTGVLVASADSDRFLSTANEPGVLIELAKGAPGTLGFQRAFDAIVESRSQGTCVIGDVIDFDDGTYVGAETTFECASGLTLTLIAATNSNADLAFTVIIATQPENAVSSRNLIMESLVIT